MRPFISALGGAAVTLALVLSCSDDSPGDADAAENCEPPLAGRLMRLEDLRTNQGGSNIIAGASCPAGAMLLGGGCEVDGQNAGRLILNEGGANSANGAYSCQWQNPDSILVETVRSWAVCLTPAPTN